VPERQHQEQFGVGDESGSLAVMHSSRGQQIESGVMMLEVVPGKELLAETASILNRSETVRILRPLLHGFEVGFGEGVVVTGKSGARGDSDPGCAHGEIEA
jgi:hypothetical protein